MHTTTSRMLVVVVLGVVSSATVARADDEPDLATRRQRTLEALETYAQMGSFPMDDNGMPVSEFRDAAGRLCPMAYLMSASGRNDLVDAVVRDDNTVRLADIHSGPIEAWIRTSGLTHEEVELVQGIMPIGHELPALEVQPGVMQAYASGQVTGQLAMVRRVLARDSASSVAVAKKRVVKGAQADELAEGPVVPADVKAKDDAAAKAREQAAARDRVKKH